MKVSIVFNGFVAYVLLYSSIKLVSSDISSELGVITPNSKTLDELTVDELLNLSVEDLEALKINPKADSNLIDNLIRLKKENIRLKKEIQERRDAIAKGEYTQPEKYLQPAEADNSSSQTFDVIEVVEIGSSKDIKTDKHGRRYVEFELPEEPKNKTHHGRHRKSDRRKHHHKSSHGRDHGEDYCVENGHRSVHHSSRSHHHHGHHEDRKRHHSHRSHSSGHKAHREQSHKRKELPYNSEEEEVIEHSGNGSVVEETESMDRVSDSFELLSSQTITINDGGVEKTIDLDEVKAPKREGHMRGRSF